jgi:hypothetical protein
MDKKSKFENEVVSVVSDLEENQELNRSKKTWIKPTIQGFSVLKKTEGGVDVTPEFVAGALS